MLCGCVVVVTCPFFGGGWEYVEMSTGVHLVCVWWYCSVFFDVFGRLVDGCLLFVDCRVW